MRTLQSEFPNFILDVKIPSGFEDNCWHNDVAPRFVEWSTGLNLFIDEIDEDRREYGDQFPRFMLSRYDEDDEWNKDIIITDNWYEILHAIATNREKLPVNHKDKITSELLTLP